MNFNKAEFTASYGISKQLPKSEKLEIAFAGRSNVGKSSAINKIFNRKNLARTSSVPGKTATINFFDCENVTFVDLPGYGYAKVGKSEKHRWSELIEGYFNQERNLALVILLIDMRHSATKLDLDMLDYLVEREIPFLVLLTKCDKLNKTETQERLEGFAQEFPYEDITMIRFSSLNATGVEEIRKVISEVTKQDDIDE
ncbi:MAG: ribosome biogenesis GTP-binding protein YihA/YsxC [Oscillospiraceae bacterium]